MGRYLDLMMYRIINEETDERILTKYFVTNRVALKLDIQAVEANLRNFDRANFAQSDRLAELLNGSVGQDFTKFFVTFANTKLDNGLLAIGPNERIIYRKVIQVFNTNQTRYKQDQQWYVEQCKALGIAAYN